MTLSSLKNVRDYIAQKIVCLRLLDCRCKVERRLSGEIRIKMSLTGSKVSHLLVLVTLKLL